jgi:hypothetical protein
MFYAIRKCIFFIYLLLKGLFNNLSKLTKNKSTKLKLIDMNEFKLKNSQDNSDDTDDIEHDLVAANDETAKNELVAIYDIKIQDECSNNLDFKCKPLFHQLFEHENDANNEEAKRVISQEQCDSIEESNDVVKLGNLSQTSFPTALKVDYVPKGKIITVNVSMMW